MVRTFLREHRLVLGIAFLLVLIIKAPVFFFPYVADDAYRGINLYHYGNLAVDEDFYLTRGKEVLEGHSLGNPLMREGKESYLDYYFTVNEAVLVGPFRLLGLEDSIDIVALYTFYNTIGIFLLVLFIYFFALELLRDKLFAAATAVFVVSGYSILDHRAFFEPVFNMYGRSLHPYLSSLALFGYLTLCLKAVRIQSTMRMLVAGAMFGALSFIYSYAWTFAALWNSFLFLIFICKKDWAAAKTLFYISLFGGLISIYNVARTYLYLVSEAGQQSILFYGAKFGRFLSYSKIGPAAIILFGILAYKQKEKTGALATLALLLAGWFVINQQLLTGLSIQSNHYLWYYTFPAFIIALTYAFFSLVRKERVRTILLILGICISLGNTAVEQYRAFAETLPERLYEQHYAPLLDVLAKEQESVVLAADDDPELLITVYTPHDILWESILGKFNDNPIQRHMDALAIFLYLNTDARRGPRAYLIKELGSEGTSLYERIYRDIEVYYSGKGLHEYTLWSESGNVGFARYRSALLASFMRRYESLLKDPLGFEKLLDRYGVKWVLWDKNRQPEWDLGALTGLREVVSSGGVSLFKRSPR